MRACVAGGGLSGLTAAYRLLEGGLEVDLFEAGPRVGGLLGTESIEGSVVETGGDSILTEKPWAVRLAEELGLQSELIATRSGQRGAYIVHRGKLERVPEGFSLLAPVDLGALARSPLLSTRGKLRAALELVLPRGSGDDESLEGFVVRRFGRELFDKLAQPLAGGIYGADPARLSLRATMPRFLDLEQKYGSVTRGLRARAAEARGAAREQGDESSALSGAATGARYGLFAAFKGGMQTLIDALQQRLGERIHTNTMVNAIQHEERGYRVEVSGRQCEYDALVVALPAYAAAHTLHDFDRPLAEELAAIDYASAATVSMSWPRSAIAHPLDAFGFVVPAVERRAIIASTWSSVKYEGRAPEGTVLIRVFIGGHRGQHLVNCPDPELVDIARRELAQLLGATEPPTWTLVKRYVRAMPQYHMGHLARVSRIEQLAQRHPRFALAGNAYRGVGIPDAVKSGNDAARLILEG